MSNSQIGWFQTDLSELINTLESGARPKGGVSVDSGDIPSLGGENILQSGGVTLRKLNKVQRSFYAFMTKGILQDLDVLINKDGANTGKLGLFRTIEIGEACINEHLFIIRGCPDKITQEFLYYLLLWENSQRIIKNKISGSAQPGLNSKFTKKFSVVVPRDIAEQTQIAEILSIIDKALEKTEVIIEKQKRIKTGLMQDLLTKGIDEDGNIRSEETHEFKDSPVGRIPVDWDVKNIKQVAQVTKLAGFEFTNYFQYIENGEIIAIRALNIKNEKLVLSDIQRISKTVSDKLPRSKVNKDDVLITYIGAYIGDVLRINESNKYHLAPNVAKITVGQNLLPEFLEIALRADYLKRQIKNLTAVTATPSLTMTQIRLLEVAFPKDKDEQEIIADRIKSINNSIESDVQVLKNLKREKTGLMQDFLTGKVRVIELLNKKKEVQQVTR